MRTVSKRGELEGEFAEMNGWEAETDAEQLLNGLGIEPELHYAQMADLTGSQKVKSSSCKSPVRKPGYPSS